jgi:hypothetical protein
LMAYNNNGCKLISMSCLNWIALPNNFPINLILSVSNSSYSLLFSV